MSLMDERQYNLTREMTKSPWSSTTKWAELIGIPHMDVLRAKASMNFEQYKSDRPLEDLMNPFGSMFGMGGF